MLFNLYKSSSEVCFTGKTRYTLTTCKRAPLKCVLQLRLDIPLLVFFNLYKSSSEVCFTVKTRYTLAGVLQPVKELPRSAFLQVRQEIPPLVLFNLYKSSSEVCFTVKTRYTLTTCKRAPLVCFTVKTRYTLVGVLQPVKELLWSAVLQLRQEIPLQVLFNL